MANVSNEQIKIPRHLAIILDGNGRWALSQGQARTFGHKIGANTMKEMVNYAFSLGIEVISLYCFSTENWKRSKEEIDYLFTLPIEYFNKYMDKLIEDDIRVIISGDISSLPKQTILACDSAVLKTKDCKSHVLNICLNYGGHDEIIRAVKQIAYEVKNDKVDVKDINEEMFSSYLYTKDLPMVDLLIRTSNEKRISNFMLWQISYAEIYFCKTLWPAFTKSDLDKALKDFSKRKRRFGGI
ncbi:MAG: isoprenyl transferase [Erysipelotrichaceae bacterium]|nr:isoprenyl transferase [Erysipelotrichaceae bacterium]